MAVWRSRLSFLRWGIRAFDVLVLMAYPTLGAIFALPQVNWVSCGRLAIFSIFNSFLLVHIYLINDWSDARLNPAEPRQRKIQALKRPEIINERQILGLAMLLLALSLIGFYFLSPVIFDLTAVIALLTMFYSHPRINGKGIPVLSTLIHLAFAILYFLAGWTLYRPLSPPAAALGLYFGLVLSAGHFSNEIEDFQSDSQAGIRTNAIAFGQRPVFRLGLALFLLSSLYLLGLAVAGWVDQGFAWIGGTLTLAWIIQIVRYRRWQAGDPIHTFRDSYRMVYALVSLAMLALLLWEKS